MGYPNYKVSINDKTKSQMTKQMIFKVQKGENVVGEFWYLFKAKGKNNLFLLWIFCIISFKEAVVHNWNTMLLCPVFQSCNFSGTLHPSRARIRTLSCQHNQPGFCSSLSCMPSVGNPSECRGIEQGEQRLGSQLLLVWCPENRVYFLESWQLHPMDK